MKDEIFNSHRTTIVDTFFLHTLCLTIAFRLEHVLFYQFHAIITIFSSKKCPVRLQRQNVWHNMTSKDVKNDVKIDVLTSCKRSSYTPSYETEISRTGENQGKPCLVCKKYSARPYRSNGCANRMVFGMSWVRPSVGPHIFRKDLVM